MTDLNAEVKRAQQKSRSGPGGGGDPSSVLRDLFFNLPGGEGNSMSRDMEGIERIRAQGQFWVCDTWDADRVLTLLEKAKAPEGKNLKRCLLRSFTPSFGRSSVSGTAS